jgi:hypothetical protein
MQFHQIFEVRDIEYVGFLKIFRIENILNKTVESIPFRPLPGRVYSINLQLNLNK